MSPETLTAILKALANRRIGVTALLGFASGLPLALTGGTLQAWMTVEGVDLSTIGIFTLVGLPYTVKFLWAPLMDRFALPWLGRRRGWILMCQMTLAMLIVVSGFLSPRSVPWWLALLAFLIAFCSASQDIVVDAYRTDVLRQPERGMGAAVFVTGYRVAMLVSGALALILSEYIGWRSTYIFIGFLLFIGILATWMGPEPEDPGRPPRTLSEAVGGPLREYFSRPGAWVFLALIVLYKLGDAFAGSLTTAFLIRGVGFSVGEVGAINKGLGLAATIFGALFGGALMARFGLFRSLLGFGILQAVSNLTFMVLAHVGKSYLVLVLAVGFENLAGGMGTAAFVGFLMALCDHRYTATQFALLSALAALGRVYVGPVSGFLVEGVGWVWFFFFTFIAALPGLILLWAMQGTIGSLENKSSPPSQGDE
ncbi:MAG: muropeptide transporter AmpG [Nitrospinae bacterium CG11_big_fil_rev_8_21_14_0_20_56_8]|nr:MAG: muropeptide transporter AmpG [Nitrospinae bacterium CG11_big_fil_rev_8_21_14_0_20_56_8]